MGVTLPFVLLLLDYWPLKRIAEGEVRSAESGNARKAGWRVCGRLLLEKVPFLVLSGLACAVTVHAQNRAIVATGGLSVGARILHAMIAYVHYAGAAFVPRHLAVFYPYELRGPLPVMAGLGAMLILGLVTITKVKFARGRPYLLTGWLWFLGTLIPVIGIVQVGDQAWADRYMYLPLVGLAVAVVWGVADLIRSRWMLIGTASAVALAMIIATALQLSYWKDTRSLFAHTFKVTRHNSLAVTLLGSILAQEGNLDEAMQDYRIALEYNPGFPEACFFLGNALEQKGKMDEALAAYQGALWYQPIAEQTHIFIGMLLAKQFKYDEAIAHYRTALALNPDSAPAHNNLARILHSQGRLDEAVEEYRSALALDPKLSLAHNNLGILLLQKGKGAESVRQLREALRLNPGNAETKFNLALALSQQHEWSEAAKNLAEIVGPGSTDAKARCELANALEHLGKTREAMSQYAAALLLQEDNPDALAGLSWILATTANSDLRNGAQAVGMAERACELTGHKDADKLKTLAAAYAEVGKFPDAIAAVQAAKQFATGANRPELAHECQLMLEQFQASKPWRETQSRP